MKLTLSNGKQIDPLTLTGGSQPDISVVNFQKKLKQLEGGDYQNRSGDAGSSAGAYQWNNDNKPLKPGETPSHWKNAASKFLKDANAPMTQENQDFVAYQQIKEYKDQGLSPEEIDALWNGAHKDEQTGKYVHNSKTRQEAFRKLALGTTSTPRSNINISPSKKTGDYITTANIPRPPVQDNLGIKEDQGIGTTVINTLGDIAGVKAMGQGLGYGISNALGTQKDIIKANERNIQIQTDLLKKIKENERIGKDTSKLKIALADITKQIQTIGGQVEKVGTGGITNKDVLLSAGQTALLPLMAYGGSVVKGTSALPSFKRGTAVTQALKSPYLEASLQGTGIKNMTEFSKMTSAGKLNTLTDALRSASASDRIVLQDAIDKVMPMAIKELGVANFAQKYPLLVKAGGLLRFLGKNAVGVGIGAGLGVTGNEMVKRVLKK